MFLEDVIRANIHELFPGTQVTIGPVIENGFYYDFATQRPFLEEDLRKIEVWTARHGVAIARSYRRPQR